MPIFRRDFWRSYLIALRRSRRDTRARAISLRVSFWLLYILCLIPFEFFLLRKSGDSLGIVLADTGLLIGATLVVVVIRRSHRRQDELFKYSFVSTAPQESVEAPSASVRAYLIDRAAITAALLSRAASEWYVQNKELPSGVEVVTRRTQNEILRRENLWEKLEADEADMFRAADGHWKTDQVDSASSLCEYLRLLRWVLGLDAKLFPLTHFPRVDVSLTQGLVERRQKVFQGKSVLATWDVRVERDAADQYFARCIAEIVARRKTSVAAEVDEWAHGLRDDLMGPSKDFVVGTQTIGELDESTLRAFFIIASARTRYAGYLVDILASGVPVTFKEWSEAHS